MFSITVFFSQCCTGWTLVFAVAIMHDQMIARMRTGANVVAGRGFDPTRYRWVNDFGSAMTRQLIETDIGTA